MAPTSSLDDHLQKNAGRSQASGKGIDNSKEMNIGGRGIVERNNDLLHAAAGSCSTDHFLAKGGKGKGKASLIVETKVTEEKGQPTNTYWFRRMEGQLTHSGCVGGGGG